MTGYSMRQGTIYRKISDGTKLLLIHHNPMQLESMVIPGDDTGFDTAHPALISIDTLIALRRSGEYEEKEDLPADVLKSIIAAVISGGGVTQDAAKLLCSISEQ